MDPLYKNIFNAVNRNKKTRKILHNLIISAISCYNPYIGITLKAIQFYADLP
jgi:hypothetical protein